MTPNVSGTASEPVFHAYSHPGPPVSARLGARQPHRRLRLGRRTQAVGKHRRIEAASRCPGRIPQSSMSSRFVRLCVQKGRFVSSGLAGYSAVAAPKLATLNDTMMPMIGHKVATYETCSPLESSGSGARLPLIIPHKSPAAEKTGPPLIAGSNRALVRKHGNVYIALSRRKS